MVGIADPAFPGGDVNAKVENIIARKGQNSTGGYLCPLCSNITAVIDSRRALGSVRRRRACTCGHRFTTYEAEMDCRQDFVVAVDAVSQQIEAALSSLKELQRVAAYMRDVEIRRYGAALPPQQQTPQEAP